MKYLLRTLYTSIRRCFYNFVQSSPRSIQRFRRQFSRPFTASLSTVIEIFRQKRRLINSPSSNNETRRRCDRDGHQN